MPQLLNQLALERCPHCSVATPLLQRVWGPAQLQDHANTIERLWSAYCCGSCGSVVLAQAPKGKLEVERMWPTGQVVSEQLPERARAYLEQAIASLSAPAGAVMLAASSVDAMLKEKGYKTGTLNSRIDEAAKNHLITSEMAAWAHEIRLDANDQRHSDELATLPTSQDAERVIDFASALAQFLYVLPARVQRGRKGSAA